MMKRTFNETLRLLCEQTTGYRKKTGELNVTQLANAMDLNQSTLKRMLDPDYTQEPKQGNLTKIADFFGVSLDQLAGLVPMPGVDVTDSNRQIQHSVSGPVPIRGWIPLITYAQAGRYKTDGNRLDFSGSERVRPTTTECSKSTFALRVEGDSMTLPEGVRGHSFPHGIIIYIDSESIAKPDHYVIARSISDGSVNFRQLMLDEGRHVLVALNPDKSAYPTIRGQFEIIGRVIDATWGGL
jgi:SOS-response transcriptional repressor LexA